MKLFVLSLLVVACVVSASELPDDEFIMEIPKGKFCKLPFLLCKPMVIGVRLKTLNF